MFSTFLSTFSLKPLRCFGSEVSARGLARFFTTEPPKPFPCRKYALLYQLCLSYSYFGPGLINWINSDNQTNTDSCDLGNDTESFVESRYHWVFPEPAPAWRCFGRGEICEGASPSTRKATELYWRPLARPRVLSNISRLFKIKLFSFHVISS